MSYLDLETARRHCREIRELVLRRGGGERDDRSLQRVQELARATSSAVGDRQCRDCTGALQDYACEYFAEVGDAARLRSEMLRELEALEARLAALEALREAVARHQGRPELHLR